MHSYSRRNNQFKFHILQKDSSYIAIYNGDSINHVLDDLEEQGYIYIDWIRAETSIKAIEQWKKSQKVEVTRLNRKIQELQKHIEELELEIESLKKESQSSREFKTNFNFNKISAYAIMGLADNCADLDSIKRNYKRLSNIYHTDKIKGETKNDEMMKMINDAYNTLTKNKS